MQFLVLLALLGFLQAAVAQTWQTGGVAKYTTMVGVSAVSASEAYGAVMDNTVGFGVVRTTDYAATGTFYGPAGGFNMDIAYSADGSLGAIAGMGGVFLGVPASADFTKVAGIHGMSQNVETWSQKSFGATGQFSFSAHDAVNGVVVTLDGGQTWSHSDIGVDASHYYARYGAFPSDTTWFVTSGMWPSDEVNARSRRDHSRLSAYLTFTSNHTLVATPNVRVQKSRGKLGDDNTTGWYGGISRTTDGGKTWTQVFNTDLFYFNQIHCSDVNTCLAVGENDDGAFVVSSKDGGNTWATVLTAPAGVSLAAVRMLSATEAWVSGGSQGRGGLQGNYYHTTDGGATWNLETASGYSFDLSFKDGVGYSAYLTQSYSSMAVYK